MNKHFLMAVTIAVILLRPGIGSADARSDPTDLLQEYLRIDTTNPPGNEARATEFIARLLTAEGIDYTIAESAAGRANLWARLGGGDRPGLLLLHHTDVVSADAKAWDVPPLAGEIRDGHLYGRGALDMKGLGIMHLVTFIELHRAGRPLNRDVVFMATADEEAGSAFGMGWMMENHANEFDAIGLALTEGGGGVGMNGAISYGVEVAQKYPVWLRLNAAGTPGHGSTPGADGAVDRLLNALDAIRNTPFEPRLVPAVAAYFKDLSGRFPGKLGLSLRDAQNAIDDPQFSEMLRTNIPQLYALTRNTCAITRLAGSDKVNVLPPTASAEIDCRLLPDQDRAAFLAELEQRIDDPQVDIEILMSLSPAESPADSELFDAIEAAVLARFPDASVGPSVTTGFTDSHHLRKRGIVSYGLMPAIIPLPDWGGIHGNNERISLENITLGTELTRDIVERLVYD